MSTNEAAREFVRRITAKSIFLLDSDWVRGDGPLLKEILDDIESTTVQTEADLSSDAWTCYRPAGYTGSNRSPLSAGSIEGVKSAWEDLGYRRRRG